MSRQCQCGRGRRCSGSLGTKNNAALCAGIHGHLDFIGEITKVGGLGETGLEKPFLPLNDVVGAIVEGAPGSLSTIARIPVIIVAVVTQGIV